MKKLTYILSAAVVLMMAACKEEVITAGKGDGAPGVVTNTSVENLPGAARITYTLPDNVDLLYIKAVFTSNGKQREVKSSLFNKSMIVEGFGDTKSYEVKLYAVNRYEEASQPVSVTVQPLEPPVITIRKSITTQPDFGGMSFKYMNATEAEVSMHVLTKDANNDWVPVDIHYTKRKEGTFAVRGFAATERTFGIFVKDRWDNHSDTINVKLTPVFETELARSNFKELKLASDAPLIAADWNIAQMFNDQFADICYHTAVGSGMPQWFTLDMTKIATLSRFKVWQRQGNMFDYGNVKSFEIYGSNNPSDDWSSWTKLGSFEAFRPSGLPNGAPPTTEDKAYAAAGEEYVFPPGIPAVRYLRFKTLANWSGGNFIHILELRFWGIQ